MQATKGKAKTSQKKAKPASGLFGWHGLGSGAWLRRSRVDSVPAHAARVFYVGADSLDSLEARILKDVPEWQWEKFRLKKDAFRSFAGPDGPIFVIWPRAKVTSGATPSHGGLFRSGAYARARDMAGQLWAEWDRENIVDCQLEFVDASTDEKFGFLVGLELASYRYLRARQQRSPAGEGLKTLKMDVDDSLFQAAAKAGSAVNLARHFINVPPHDLNPETYANAVAQIFAESTTTQIEILDPHYLEKNNFGLISAVGRGAIAGPRIVIVRYRPKGAGKNPRRVAIVGKGVTFDTGGLDLKASDAMRLMKKDMGGSAAVLGFMHWLDEEQLNFPCDAYLALAENAVSDRAYHPSDVLISRGKVSVEIGNTDAEGRLVMGDALELAIEEGKEQLDLVLDVATLTGAIKVALGTKLAGLFSNDDALSQELVQAGYQAGDLCWRMPLVPEYVEQLRSSVADINNSGTSRFGGAITAALFLEKFTHGKKWAHLDIYSWADSANGAFREEGGNGQAVQLLMHWAKARVSRND